MRCFTMAHIAHWWGIKRSSVTMMRKRWGPDSAAPFPAPDVEMPTIDGDTTVAGWAWERWPAEFEAWDTKRKQVPRRRSGASAAEGPPAGRPTAAAKPAEPQPTETPASVDDGDGPDPAKSIRTRDYIKPGRRSHSGARQGRIVASRVMRSAARGRNRW
ncbi:hypothetical protein DL991_41225 [Amycolatopsis sp. WAC 01375]|nr:hypothetical protein DL991_41225 [Amycolatopsis sp. WAC 01375]